MRLWSIHPKYLDTKGLVALWREALLAQKVLFGLTIGYKNHPQLERFKSCKKPISSIGYYLLQIWKEASSRKFIFDKNKILEPTKQAPKIVITKGQIDFEFSHLIKKLKVRALKHYKTVYETEIIEPHPLFKVIPGDKESWEK